MQKAGYMTGEVLVIPLSTSGQTRTALETTSATTESTTAKTPTSATAGQHFCISYMYNA